MESTPCPYRGLDGHGSAACDASARILTNVKRMCLGLTLCSLLLLVALHLAKHPQGITGALLVTNNTSWLPSSSSFGNQTELAGDDDDDSIPNPSANCPWWKPNCWTWYYIAYAFSPFLCRCLAEQVLSFAWDVFTAVGLECVMQLFGFTTNATLDYAFVTYTRWDWNILKKYFELENILELLPVALFRLFFWHLLQPAAYAYILYWCYAGLGPEEKLLAWCVLFREMLYAVACVAAACFRPAFLFCRPRGFLQWVWFICSPEELVFAAGMTICPAARSWTLVGKNRRAGCLILLATALNFTAVVGCVHGLRTGAPAALLIGYFVAAASTPVGAFLGIRALLNHDIDSGGGATRLQQYLQSDANLHKGKSLDELDARSKLAMEDNLAAFADLVGPLFDKYADADANDGGRAIGFHAYCRLARDPLYVKLSNGASEFTWDYEAWRRHFDLLDDDDDDTLDFKEFQVSLMYRPMHQ